MDLFILGIMVGGASAAISTCWYLNQKESALQFWLGLAALNWRAAQLMRVSGAEPGVVAVFDAAALDADGVASELRELQARKGH